MYRWVDGGLYLYLQSLIRGEQVLHKNELYEHAAQGPSFCLPPLLSAYYVCFCLPKLAALFSTTTTIIIINICTFLSTSESFTLSLQLIFMPLPSVICQRRECHLCRVAGNTVWSHYGMWVPVAVRAGLPASCYMLTSLYFNKGILFWDCPDVCDHDISQTVCGNRMWISPYLQLRCSWGQRWTD